MDEGGFDTLARELDRWGEAGRIAHFWWRDDDAAEPTDALTRLLDLSAKHGAGLAVAVIPAIAQDNLPSALTGHALVVPVQHGWAHANHAAPGEKTVELGGARPVETVLDEMRLGFARMTELFAKRFPPVLAAPWNRVAPDVLARLPEAGFAAASAAGPRGDWIAQAPGTTLRIENIHVDPIDWKRTRGFTGEAKAVASVVGELAARREGRAEADEPVGLLTHHLVHDAGTWDFVERLLTLTTRHPAARWMTIGEVFP